MRFLAVKNWRRFQHYTNRNPPWIKFHKALLDDTKFNDLGAQTRLMYVLLLLVAARKENLIPKNVQWLAGEVNMPVSATRKAVDTLVSVGFLYEGTPADIASRVASEDASDRDSVDASPTRASARSQEAEAEQEKRTQSSARDVATAIESPDRGNLGTASYGHALRLVASLRHRDDHTKEVVCAFASKLPPAAFETVREKVGQGNGRIRNDAAYAVSELERMVTERQYG